MRGSETVMAGMVAALLAATAPAAAQDSAAATDSPAAGTIESAPGLDGFAIPASDPDPAAGTPAGSEAEASAATETPAPANDLAATIYITNNYEGFRKAWAKGPKAELPLTQTISLIHPVFAMIAVPQCRPAKDGKCNIAIAWRTAGPDGIFDELRTGADWHPTPPRDRPVLATAAVRLALDRSDPPGIYTIEVTVTDRVADTRATLTGTVTKPAVEAGR